MYSRFVSSVCDETGDLFERTVNDPAEFFGVRLRLNAQVFGRRGTDPTAAFLHGLDEKHKLSETEFRVDGYGNLTILSRLNLGGWLEYSERNHIETCPISST